MFENIDFGNHVISKFIDFEYNTNKTLLSQIDLLKEDILQICYSNGYILDIGWYPEFHEEGAFKITIVKDYKWDAPFMQNTCRNLTELNNLITDYVYLMQNYFDF